MSTDYNNGFDKAQRSYDNQLPPEDERNEVECPVCEGTGTIEYDENGETVTDRCNKCRGDGVIDE